MRRHLTKGGPGTLGRWIALAALAGTVILCTASLFSQTATRPGTGKAAVDAAQAREALPQGIGADAARMAWWREARFGLFIHWGLYSIPAGEWKGNTTYGEWILNNAQIPIPVYEQFRLQFNPVKFDAREWVRIAKDAGVRYIVLTTKHHDGFGLFDSALGDWNVMSTPFKRDVLKELVDACREAGMRIGWYHSIMDWHHLDYLPRRDWDKRPTQGASFDRYVEYLKGQVREILTKYGPIDVMWFDGQWEGTWTHERGLDMYRYVRSLQPNIIVNNRVDKGGGDFGLTRNASFAGDFGTPEQEVPPTGLPGVDWESCMTMNDNWGYNSHDQNWKSSEQLIRTLADVASKGGNLLLNVGPTSEGLFPQPSIDRLAAMGKWLRTNGDAIYGTTASPFPALAWGRTTQKRMPDGATRLYLHVFDWPRNGRLSIPGLLSNPTSVYLLGDPSHKPILAVRDADAVLVPIPFVAPDPVDTVVVLEIKGEPEVALPPTITAPLPIFVDTLNVTVTSGQEDVELRYTTNNLTPDATSPVVSGSIKLAATATVTARAFRAGKPVSPVARATFSKVLPQKPVTVDGIEPGVRYQYFEGSFERTVDMKAPLSRGVAKRFDLTPRTTKVHFGFRYEGFLKVPAPGVYEFALTSDDGSRLMIGNETVVDNDGPHGAREKTGVIALGEGLHRIQLDYFQATGDLDLKVSWSGPDRPRQPIAEKDLFVSTGVVRIR